MRAVEEQPKPKIANGHRQTDRRTNGKGQLLRGSASKIWNTTSIRPAVD